MESLKPLRYRIVNVFAETRLGGNPLCVFEDGRGLDAATMQALALQFNLSETTFVLPATGEATCAVRIFTPAFELPFAGHPTLGTAHVVRDLLGAGDQVRLEMQAGVIPVRAEGDAWTLRANPPTWHDPGLPRERIAKMLGVEPRDVQDGALWVDTGSEQLIVPLASPDAVRRMRPSAELLARYSIGAKRRGLAYAWAWGDTGQVRARFFLEKQGGLLEDPGTGSACANLGGWLLAQRKRLPIEVKVLQGEQVGRPCVLGLVVDADRQIHVSGRVVALGGGEILL